MAAPVRSENLLVNPEFAHLAVQPGPALYAAAWNTDARGDAEFVSATGVFAEADAAACARLLPGKRLRQFISLADLDEEDSALRAAQRVFLRYSSLERREFRRRLGSYLARRGFAYPVIDEVLDGLWEGPRKEGDAQ